MSKSIGIILVILGHTFDIPNNLYLSIFSFHMPIFFILSGMVFNKNKNINMGFGNFIKKRFFQYMIPYYIFGFVDLVIEIMWRIAVTKKNVDFSYIIGSIKGIMLCSYDLPIFATPIWFLFCLFVSNLIFFQILKLRLRNQCIIICFSLLLHYILITWIKDCVPYMVNFPNFVLSTFFMWIGYNYKYLIDKFYLFLNSSIIIIIDFVLVFFSFYLVILTQNKVNLRSNTFGNYFVFLFSSILISLGLIFIIKKFIFLKNSFLLWLGQNTMYIIGFNYVCMFIGVELYYLMPFVKNHSIHWTANFIITFVLCLISICICKKIRKLFSEIVSNK